MQVVFLPDIDMPRQFLSRLEPLVPKGLGTAKLECLTSYLCRLANHHWLTPYALRKYVETHHLDNMCGARKYFGFREPTTINGQGITASCVAAALSHGTGRSDLLNLTVYGWAPALDRVGKGLLHQSLHWCPECWREDEDNDGEPYARLAWMTSVYVCCPVHNRLLSNECPYCFTEQRVVPTFPRQWICQQCGQNLFRKGITSGRRLKPTSKQLWHALSIEKLIERTCGKGEHIREGSIEHAVDQLAIRYTVGSSAELGKKLNITTRYLENWRRGKSRPTLLSLSDLCYRIDIPIDQFLIDSDLLTDPALWRDIESPHFIESSRLSDKRKNEIEQFLKKIISFPPKIPPAVSEIATKFNMSYTSLNSHFPAEYKILKQRALTWRKQRAIEKGKDRIHKLSSGVRQLVKAKIYPGERQLRRSGYLIPSDLRRPEVLEKLKELQSQHAYLLKISD